LLATTGMSCNDFAASKASFISSFVFISGTHIAAIIFGWERPLLENQKGGAASHCPQPNQAGAKFIQKP
jgi:hypothetical protein